MIGYIEKKKWKMIEVYERFNTNKQLTRDINWNDRDQSEICLNVHGDMFMGLKHL